jgi:hypothetical protein
MPSGFIEAHVYPLRRVSSGSCNHLHIHLSSDIVARFGRIDRSHLGSSDFGVVGPKRAPLSGRAQSRRTGASPRASRGHKLVG